MRTTSLILILMGIAGGRVFAAEPMTLKEAYAKDFLIGTALNSRQVFGEWPQELALVERHFNSITPENLLKWEMVHPEPKEYHFEPADRFVEYGERHGMFIVGHTLVWHSQTPRWVFRGEDGEPADRETLLERMREHIHTVMGRYKGRIGGWDVVNEAVEDNGSLRNSRWRRIIGDDYIAKAFEFAREADPEAELYYNDFDMWKKEKRDGVIRLVKDLQARGLRIDGIGMQGHWGLDYPEPEEAEASIEAFAALGVKVMITELDVTVLPVVNNYFGAEVERRSELNEGLNPYPDGLPAELERQFTKRCAEFFSLFHRHADKISRVTFWGVHDGNSWRNNFPMRGRTDYPLLFDRRLRPKAALSAVTAIPAETTAGRTFTNPVLSGFYPDPSICRVGDDYYMVHSTFEYFPGVPIFHSRDLVHWRQIGYCLTRKSQLSLEQCRASGGIYAPTLRWHDGTFYMITTNVCGGGSFYVTATDPAGPWSAPVRVDQSGIDPSLLFDDDGRVYYMRHEGGERGGIGQQEIDLKTGRLKGEMKMIWRGTGGIWPEGPHLYKINGKYYLMIAEGGTSYGHMVTIARSDSPFGPFESNPKNPILTHKDRRDHPIQALGHADLVQTPAGWWMVCLGIRPQGGAMHHLGRETFLAPVEWGPDGWPTVNGGRGIELVMEAPKLPPHPFPKEPARDEFEGERLGLAWNFLRNPQEENYSLSERPGYLRLKGSAVTMSDAASPTFVGQRQRDLNCTVSAKLDFVPNRENEEAGMVVRGNDQYHYDLGLTLKNGRRQAFFRKVLDGRTIEPVTYVWLPDGEVTFTITASPLSYEFACRTSENPVAKLGNALTGGLSSEKIGGFTGVYIGIYATGNGKASTSPADFDYFEYKAATTESGE
jgi:beta-xylosidase/GH35 family endo-1,4-beta-xylanase